MRPEHIDPRALPEGHARLLTRFGGLGDPRRLGQGGEATVYALDEHRVLRIHHEEPWAGAELEAAYGRWSTTSTTSFRLPEVLASGVEDGLWWQVMRRYPGQTVGQWLKGLRGPERIQLLEAYVDAAFEIGTVESGSGYGELLGGGRYPTWADCLRARLQVPDPRLREQLAAEVPELGTMVDRFEEHLPELYDGPPRLVHVDYFPGNVMAAPNSGTPNSGTPDCGTPDRKLRICGVFDFAAHSLFGDPLLDVVGAVVMADMLTDVSEAEQAHMTARARSRAGSSLDRVLESYRTFYALYYAMDPALLPWCARQLRRSLSFSTGPTRP